MTPTSERMRPKVERMCHWLETMQTFLVSQFRSIYGAASVAIRSPRVEQESEWLGKRRDGEREREREREPYAHAAHVAAAVAVVHVAVIHAGVVHVGVVHRDGLLLTSRRSREVRFVGN